MKFKGMVIRTTVYKSGDTAVRFFIAMEANVGFEIEISGDEFVRYFDLASLGYPSLGMDSFSDEFIFSVMIAFYREKKSE